MNRLSTPLLILVLALSTAASGCNPFLPILAKFRTPEVHLAPGQVAEVRRPTTVPVWVHDAKNGDLKKGYMVMYPTWLGGPPPPAPAEK